MLQYCFTFTPTLYGAQVGIVLKKSVVEEERRITAKKEEISSLIKQHIEAEKYVVVVKALHL